MNISEVKGRVAKQFLRGFGHLKLNSLCIQFNVMFRSSMVAIRYLRSIQQFTCMYICVHTCMYTCACISTYTYYFIFRAFLCSRLRLFQESGTWFVVSGRAHPRWNYGVEESIAYPITLPRGCLGGNFLVPISFGSNLPLSWRMIKVPHVSQCLT